MSAEVAEASRTSRPEIRVTVALPDGIRRWSCEITGVADLSQSRCTVLQSPRRRPSRPSSTPATRSSCHRPCSPTCVLPRLRARPRRGHGVRLKSPPDPRGRHQASSVHCSMPIPASAVNETQRHRGRRDGGGCQVRTTCSTTSPTPSRSRPVTRPTAKSLFVFLGVPGVFLAAILAGILRKRCSPRPTPRAGNTPDPGRQPATPAAHARGPDRSADRRLGRRGWTDHRLCRTPAAILGPGVTGPGQPLSSVAHVGSASARIGGFLATGTGPLPHRPAVDRSGDQRRPSAPARASPTVATMAIRPRRDRGPDPRHRARGEPATRSAGRPDRCISGGRYS